MPYNDAQGLYKSSCKGPTSADGLFGQANCRRALLRDALSALDGSIKDTPGLEQSCHEPQLSCAIGADGVSDKDHIHCLLRIPEVSSGCPSPPHHHPILGMQNRA